MDAPSKLKVAVIAFVHVGHMNPLLAMVRALVDRGVEVVFFGEASVREKILQAGASYVPIYDGCFDDAEISPVEFFTQWREQEGLCFDKFPLMRVQEASKYIVPLMRNLKLANPDAILHDTFCVEAYVLSKVLAIPLISHISYSGMGILGDKLWKSEHGSGWDETLSMEEYKKWREIYIARYNVDIWSENLPMQYYSKDLIITTMIEDLCLSLNPEDDPVVYESFHERQAQQIYVGPCFNEKLRINGKPTDLPKDEIVEEDPVPIILKAKEQGKKIVLISFGTVITQNLWEIPAFPVGGVGTGQAFYRTVVKRVVEALGDNEEILVVLATGLKADGIECDKPIPSNFVLRKRLVQTEILRLADCFVSHMGANSMNEALDAGVPLIPMPGFADQPVNGDLTIQAGAAYAEWDQEASGIECTAENIKRSVHKVLNDPSFAANSKRLGEKNRKAGGAIKAAEVMEAFIAQAKEQKRASSRLLPRTPSCGMESSEVSEPITTQLV